MCARQRMILILMRDNRRVRRPACITGMVNQRLLFQNEYLISCGSSQLHPHQPPGLLGCSGSTCVTPQRAQLDSALPEELAMRQPARPQFLHDRLDLIRRPSSYHAASRHADQRGSSDAYVPPAVGHAEGVNFGSCSVCIGMVRSPGRKSLGVSAGADAWLRRRPLPAIIVVDATTPSRSFFLPIQAVTVRQPHPGPQRGFIRDG
jgi:hypothetical protein